MHRDSLIGSKIDPYLLASIDPLSRLITTHHSVTFKIVIMKKYGGCLISCTLTLGLISSANTNSSLSHIIDYSPSDSKYVKKVLYTQRIKNFSYHPLLLHGPAILPSAKKYGQHLITAKKWWGRRVLTCQPPPQNTPHHNKSEDSLHSKTSESSCILYNIITSSS